ncbi:MAG TPA: Ig-like domain-containing protein [Terriglobia bacterium]|nr:Ig-like domain-containing protein [Terriglobia bacterium]
MSFETEMVDNSPGLFLLPKELHAIWWGLGGGRDARVMITNTSGASAAADVFLDFQGQRHASAGLTFAANETKVLSINQLLGDLNVSPAAAPEGGITIVPTGATPTLVAQGRIIDPATGFSTTLNFLDPSVQLVSTLHTSGLPIGTPTADSPYAGTGSFTPHVIARNLLGTAQTISITVEYPKIAGWDSTHFRKLADGSVGTAGDFTGEMPLAPLSLGPYETVDFSLDSVMSQLPLPLPYASIRVQYSGPPGSAIAEVASVEAKGDLVVDGRLENLGDGWAGSGANPWHLDAQTDSILFLSNMGEQECRIGFRMDTQGASYYLTQVMLKPHETRSINLRKLRDAQKPDFKGNLIPAGAADGSVEWIRLSNQPVMGRLLVLRHQQQSASSYQCQTCPCAASYTGLDVTPIEVAIVVGLDYYFHATASYGGCWLPFYTDVTDSATWSSGNTSVATVNRYGVATGVGAGSASMTANYCGVTYFWSGTYCTASGEPCYNNSGTCNVQVPTSLSIVGTDSTTAESSCTTGGSAGCGVTRTFKYQVNDQNGQPIRVANMAFGDVICNTATNQLNLQSYSTTCSGTTGSCSGTSGPCGQFTDANGQFSETVSVCAPACKPSGTCITAGQTIANQTWKVAGHPLNSDVKSLSYQCNKILVNGK